MSVIRKGDIRKLTKAIANGTFAGMKTAMQNLRTDVVMRLSKPRTGEFHNKAKTDRYGRQRISKKTGLAIRKRRAGGWAYQRESGPPQYPQVLSVLSGLGRRSVSVSVLKRLSDVIGVIGSNKTYLRYHEEPSGSPGIRTFDRRWLRPAISDNIDKIRATIESSVFEFIKKSNFK